MNFKFRLVYRNLKIKSLRLILKVFFIMFLLTTSLQLIHEFISLNLFSMSYQTCKEMYQHDSDEKRRKSQTISNGTTTCLETISECNEGRHQHRALTENEAKTMKSKGVQVSRNFEDSLRRYHRTPQQRSK